MTDIIEALRALEKDVEKVDALLSKSRKLDPNVMFGRVFIKHRKTVSAILATASEQATASREWLLGLMGDEDFTMPKTAFDRIVPRISPAHTSEARDAAFVEVLAREYSMLRGWSLDDWNNPSIKNRSDIIADMQMAYDAAMRQQENKGA